MIDFRKRMGKDFWDLSSHFFEAARQFRETYDTYEAKVLQYAEERGVDRRFLRLAAEEVAGLLDFRKLEHLRDEELDALKNISHNIFRMENTTDPFDRYISQIYHELSILKEEQYKVATFAPDYQREEETSAYDALMDEVHEAFPRQVHGIKELFDKAQGRLEELLPHFVRGPQGKVTMRSLYLFGDETFRGFYPNGIEDVYRMVYPGGAVEGYLAVARSFQDSGFREYAIEALEHAIRVAGEPVPARSLPEIEAPSTDGIAADANPSDPLGLKREAEDLLRDLREGSGKKKTKSPAATSAGS